VSRMRPQSGRVDGRPHTACPRRVGGAQSARASSVLSDSGRLVAQRPLTARIRQPKDLERGTTPRVRRLSLASEAASTPNPEQAATDRGEGRILPSHGCRDGTPRLGSQERTEGGIPRSGNALGTQSLKEVKQDARRKIRILDGRGNHIEREEAVNALCDYVQGQKLSRSWLVEQGNLVENIVSLAELGTPAQKDGTAVLICLLADGSHRIKEVLVRVPRIVPALVRLLKGSSDVQLVNAAATVWFLAENREFRESAFVHGEIFELLVACIDKGTSPQSEHASGALRMLTFGNERSALSTLQVDRLPEIMLRAAQSECHGEALQAMSLIAQLSSFESISLPFRTQYAALDGSIEIFLECLATHAKYQTSYEMKVQAAICLRNMLVVPAVLEMSRSIADLVPVSTACFSSSEGMLRIRTLNVLTTLAGDDKMKTEIGRAKHIYPVLLAMMVKRVNKLEVDHSLTFMKVISQDAGKNVACHDVITDMIIILLQLCGEHQPAGPYDASHAARMLNEGDVMRIKAAAVLRNLASSPAFCQTMCETEGLLETLGQLLSCCPRAGFRQALGALCNLASFDTAAGLILSFAKSDDKGGVKKLKDNFNILLHTLLGLTLSRDEWTCSQSIMTLHNLIEHDHDISQFEVQMIQSLEHVVLGRGDLSPETKVKAALAFSSLTSRDSACSLISELPDNKDAQIFGLLVGLGRHDAVPEEVVVGLWALSNVAALETNTEKKFTQVDFLLDKVGHCVTRGSLEEKVAAAAVIKNLCPHSAISAEFLGGLPGVIESLHELALSEDAATYQQALGALCTLTSDCIKNRVACVEGCPLRSSAPLAVKACRCLSPNKSDILKMYAAGLICNMASSDGGKDTTADLGRNQDIFDFLCAALSSNNSEVRINALCALCNLGHNDVNKIRIGQVHGCLERLNTFLHSGSDPEKAHSCMLIFHLSFAFKNNAEFGELPGALDKVVDLLRGKDDEQIENAAAALSILACNRKNTAWLTSEEKRASLLQTLASILKHGKSRQRVNVVVSMWNIAANSHVAKAEIGKIPSVFIWLVDFLKDDKSSELAQQTVGLLSELLHEDRRNAALFGKVDKSVENLLELSFEESLKQVVELNACWAITNFAAGDDERLRRVIEMDGGLTAMSRLIVKGDKRQQEYACMLLTSNVLKSMAGRKKIVRVQGLLSSLVSLCMNCDDQRRRHSTEILNNLAAGPSTRQVMSKIDYILKALETVVADPKSDKWSQYYATRCLASLSLDPALTDQLGDWEKTHGLLLDNLNSSDTDLVDAAAEAFHNLLASSEENRKMFSECNELMDRIMELSGEGEGRASMMHCVGSLFQLVRASKTFAQEMTTHPTLASRLVKALHNGSDKAKELSCAILAILGENDDDIGSVEDDVINMQIAMCDGSFEVLQCLCIRGTPQQAMHATAVISNVLISAGSYVKTQIAENEDFLRTLVKVTQHATPLHRTYALRLLYHMMKDDDHIIEVVGKFPNSVPVMMEMLNAGNEDQCLYASLCIAQLASVDRIARLVGSYNRGHIFKIILHILSETNSPLKGATLEILRMLCVDDVNKATIVRIEGLVEYLAQVACKGKEGHSISAAGILLQLVKGNKELRATLSRDDMALQALAHLLQLPGAGRDKASMLIFSLAAELDNLNTLVCIPNIFDTLGSIVLQGERRERDSACKALWKLLQHPDKGLQSLSEASRVVGQLIACMEERDEAGFPIASNEQEACVLSSLLQMCKDEFGCSVISVVDRSFKMLIAHAAREGLGDGHPWLALKVVKMLMQGTSACWDTLMKESGVISVVLNSVRQTNASLVEDGLCILEMLSSDKERGFHQHIIEANKDKGDVIDTLLSFCDENIMDDTVFDKKEYDEHRQRAFNILAMLAKRNQAVCNRIAQKRVSTDIISRGIIDIGGPCRQSALKLSIECTALNEHFAKKLGTERNFINTLATSLDSSAEFKYPFSRYERKLSLSLLSGFCANEMHCQTIGNATGLFKILFGIIHEGLEARLKDQDLLSQSRDDLSGKGDGREPAGQGNHTEAIANRREESAADAEDNKVVEPLEQIVEGAFLQLDVAEDLDDTTHYDIEAARLMRALIAKNKSNCNALVRVPYPVVDTLIMQALARQEQHRKHAFSNIWTIARASKFGLELLGKKSHLLMQALLKVCVHRAQHVEDVVLVLAELMSEKKCKMALLANSTLLNFLVQTMGNVQASRLAVSAVRAIECFAVNFDEGKPAIGENKELMRTLIELKYNGTEELAKSASAAIEQLAHKCDINEGVFQRLRAECAEGRSFAK
jgi:hypothetical protein